MHSPISPWSMSAFLIGSAVSLCAQGSGESVTPAALDASVSASSVLGATTADRAAGDRADRSSPVLTDESAAASRRARRAASGHITDALADGLDTVAALREILAEAADRLGAQSRQAAILRQLSAREDLDFNGLERLAERHAEEIRFEPVREANLPVNFPPTTPIGEIYLKRYPSYRMAKAEMGRGGMTGPFFKLFNHIKRNDIPMTAPVQMDYSKGNRREKTMAFLYEGPDKGTLGEDPQSRGQVEVVHVAPLMTVSIGLRGYDTPKTVAKAKQLLEEWIAAHNWVHAAGPMRRMGYNGPMVAGSRRFYEVEIPVRIEL